VEKTAATNTFSYVLASASLPFSMWLTRYYIITEHLKHYKLPQLSYFPQEIQCRFEFSSLLNAATSSLFNPRAETLFQKGQWATVNTWGHFPWKQSGRDQTPHLAPLLGILKHLQETRQQL